MTIDNALAALFVLGVVGIVLWFAMAWNNFHDRRREKIDARRRNRRAPRQRQGAGRSAEEGDEGRQRAPFDPTLIQLTRSANDPRSIASSSSRARTRSLSSAASSPS